MKSVQHSSFLIAEWSECAFFSFVPMNIILLASLALAMSVALGCKGESEIRNSVAVAKPVSSQLKLPDILNPDDQRVLDLIESEDLLLDLSISLSHYADWIEEVSAASPRDESEFPFTSLVNIKGLGKFEIGSSLKEKDGGPGFLTVAEWPIESRPKSSNPWTELLQAQNTVWDTVKFGVVSAEFTDSSQTTFEMHTKVDGRTRLVEGNPTAMADGQYGFKGVQNLVWSKISGQWRLTKWDQKSFQIKRTSKALFVDVLPSVLPTKSRTYKNAIRSYKDEMISELTKNGKVKLRNPKWEPWLKVSSEFLFPSVSVVDYDNDGHEDLFLTARWGPTQMLRNQGDGTYEEVTHEVGLYFRHLVNCATFVDLDNDGDKDVLIGRPLMAAVYLENVDGVFHDVTEEKSDMQVLPFVSSISISDVNQDGLPDAYMSTYAPLVDHSTGWAKEYLGLKEINMMERHAQGRNTRYDLSGTANVLIMNRGGGQLERVPFDQELSQWRRSYQSVWGDVDEDGDDDLFVCNDFAPDAFLRNDTPRGASQPKFVDVTETLLSNAGAGYGMGASFGDFDRDGDLDLYVSNMFSKAGLRIAKKMTKLDKRMTAATSGNFLYENDEGKFTQRAGSGADEYHVNQVGWSYGGQWADFDNDGQLDLYVPSGFFTALKESSTDIDL
jgi:hypothetical protein